MERVISTMVLDTETAELLRLLAEQEYDGNKSMTLRRIIKQAAREHKIERLPFDEPPTGEDVEQ